MLKSNLAQLIDLLILVSSDVEGRVHQGLIDWARVG